VRIRFVCLGNICRSPTAEGVMRDLLARSEPAPDVELDSAGTGAWHIGSQPDRRARAAARARGIELAGQARQIEAGDFREFDLIIGMDRSNRASLLALAPDEAARSKVRLLREFDPRSQAGPDVPDPYEGGPEGFELVLDMVEAACEGLLAELSAAQALPQA
jgi:protein-tyrosine phosphatase